MSNFGAAAPMEAEPPEEDEEAEMPEDEEAVEASKAMAGAAMAGVDN